MKYLFLMTAAGSILFVCYWCWTKLFASFMTQTMKYKAVALVLLAYVVPWVWLKGIYSYVIRWFLQVRAPAGGRLPVAIADIITKEEAYKTPDYRWQLGAVAVWLTIALILVVRKCALYICRKRKLLRVSKKCAGSAFEETVRRLRRELHYEGSLEIYITPLNNTSFTLGIIRPVIFVQEEYAEGQLYFILKHEMTHIVRKDMLWRLLLEFTCCLHWFNLFIYGLDRKFDDACEESCDERVMKSCTEDECRVYLKLLASNYDELQKQLRLRQKGIPFESRLDSYRRTEERLKLIMGAKEVKRWKKRVAAGVFAALVVMNSFTALAYPDVYHVNSEDAEAAADIIESGAFWTGDFAGNGYDEVQFGVFYEDEFIDMEGNVYPVSGYMPYVFCLKHDIVSGYLQTHRKDDNGGCTVKTYESTRCTICNSIWVGDLVNTSIWVKCPHDTK